MHVKFPWPMDRVYRFRAHQIQSFNIGVVPDPEQERERTVLWTRKHTQEELNLLVAAREQPGAATNDATGRKIAPVNLLSASIPVQFQVTNLLDYVYKHRNAPKLLEDVATREVVRFLVNADFFEVMSSGRTQAAEELRDRIQAQADQLQLGANIVYVGLQDIHPPVKVAGVFQTNNIVLQDREARILQAEGQAGRARALAQGEAVRTIRLAEAYKVRRIANEGGQAAQFTNQLAAFQASPAVYMERAYLQALARGATNARKYVLTTTNVSEVVQMDLQDKVRPDLLDTALPSAKR
jgi:regulator of protease activity HflC (stomatin/prohibitin superfamily)